MRASIAFVAVMLLGVNLWADSLTALEEQYMNTCRKWEAAKLASSGKPQTENLIFEFGQLSEKTDEPYFKAKCLYNSGQIARENNKLSISSTYYSKVVDMGAAVKGKTVLGSCEAVLYDYSAMALMGLRDNTTTNSEKRVEILDQLAQGYYQSPVVAWQLGIVNSEKLMKKITFDEWTSSVIALIEHNPKIPERYFQEIKSGLEHERDLSDKQRLSLLKKFLSIKNLADSEPAEPGRIFSNWTASVTARNVGDNQDQSTMRPALCSESYCENIN